MGWRDKLNEKPMVTGGIIGAILVILVAFWVVSSIGGGGPERPTSAYYTIDDGATWFSGSADEITPFEQDGKTAVRAHVFKCADGKEFVGYLERHTDQAKAVLEQYKADRAAGKEITNSQAVAMAEMNGKMVKRPGTRDWTNANPRVLATMTQVTCADKSSPQLAQ